MSLHDLLATPFNEGGGTSTLVPKTWDAAFNGRTYMFDSKYFGTAQHTMSSIKLLKPSQSTGEVTEESFNPADGIRAKVDSWHHGAGQTYLDRPTSDPYRFRASKGVDPWTKGKLSLLPDTDQKLSSANTNLLFAVAGPRLYVIDGQTLKYTTDVTVDSPTWTTVTGTPAATATSIASDGFNVWVAYTASGLYVTNTGTGAASQLVTTALASDSVVGYVKGRLIVSKANVLYNVIDLAGPAALPAALFTHPNTGFRWVGFAEGLAVLYAAGYAGDKSIVYKTTIKADGTSLDIPTVASSTIPDGEIVYSIADYLGVVLIGTGTGWWTASQDSAGNLTINRVQDLNAAVRCFEGQGSQIWYGWTNYDSVSSGLGRADLDSDTKGANVVTPAYASDLMATVQGAVLSVATFQSLRVFSVSGSGVWAQATTKVASGTIDGGLYLQGMPDNKVALSITLTHEPLAGTITTALAADGGDFTTIGSSGAVDSTTAYINAGATSGIAFEVRQTLERSSGDTTTGPVLTRVTLESNMAPGRGQRFNVAFLFFEKETWRGQDFTFDPVAAFDELLEAENLGIPGTFQHALGAVTATLDDHDFIIEDFTQNRDGYVGTFLAQFRVGRRRS